MSAGSGMIAPKNEMEQIYEQYFNKIYNYIFYRILHKEMTEDIVGDIFMKVFLNLEAYNPQKASVATWIFRIAENTLIDYYRVRKVHFNLNDQLNTLSIDFEEQYEQMTNSRGKQLYKLLRRLTEKQRTVLYLKYFFEMSNREISSITGINSSTVGTIHQRAIAFIKKTADYNDLASSAF